MDIIGEASGPKGQPGLRRKAFLEQSELQAVLQGCMLGRGAQVKSQHGEATVPSATDVVAVHLGGRPEGMKEVKKVFRLQDSKSDALDSMVKYCNVIYNEESVRQRKKRIKGPEPYSQQSTVMLLTQKPLIPDTIPEKRRKEFAGFNTGDVIGWVEVVPASQMWECSRTFRSRCVRVCVCVRVCIYVCVDKH